MIRNMRHRLVLSLYSSVALAGLAVFSYGLFNLVGSVLFSLVLLPQSAGGGFRIEAVAAIVGIHLMVTLVGGTVAVFAARTWWQRRHAGPAPEEASVARTSLGRILATLIFGGFAVVSGLSLYYILGAIAQDAALATSGVTTTAGIASFAPDPEVHADAFRVHYVFETADGERVTGVAGRWRWQIEALQAAVRVPVTYLPIDPHISELEFTFSLQDTLEMVGSQFAVFLVGVWGAGRNLGIWPKARRKQEPAATVPLAELRAARRNIR